MAEYLNIYFIEQLYGKSYITTQLVYAFCVVMLLNEIERTWQGILKKAVEVIGSIFLMILCNAVLYLCFGSMEMGWLDKLVFLSVYALLFSRYRGSTRIIDVSVFYTSFFLIIVISEPWGNVLKNLGIQSVGYLGSTSLISSVLLIFLTFYLKKFSTERFSMVPRFGISLMILIAAAAGSSVLLYYIIVGETQGKVKIYHVLICVIFCFLEFLGYYMFYVITREVEENIELLSMQRKAETDREMYMTTKTIYEEMSAIRHEIKNHDTYMRALLEQKDYKKLGEYLIDSQTESSEFYQYVNCGNVVINTIVNYEASAAKAQGVQLKTEIIVPHELSIRENELCSLLFNLLNNALEACKSENLEAENQIIELDIQLKGEYLFIRVCNPVDDSMSARERLKLRSTKENKKIHGYGTRVVAMIAEKYNGHVKYTMKDGRFIVDVMLEMKGLEENR